MSHTPGVQATATEDDDTFKKVDETPVRVLIADHHEDVLSATRDLVDDFAGFEVVGVAKNVADAVRRAQEIGPDLVLIDAWLKEGGVDVAAARIREVAPHARIAALSSDGEVELGRRVRALGGIGCFRKEHLAASLPAILASVRRR